LNSQKGMRKHSPRDLIGRILGGREKPKKKRKVATGIDGESHQKEGSPQPPPRFR